MTREQIRTIAEMYAHPIVVPLPKWITSEQRCEIRTAIKEAIEKWTCREH